MINKETEVSYEVVKQMASDVLFQFQSDFSVATSGYAGPAGGTKLNPVGTVFIAVSSKERTISRRFLFSGGRDSVVNQSVITGVEFLIEELKSQ